MTIAGIRDAIQTSLDTVSGLRVHDTVPDNPQPPCAWVRPATGQQATFEAGNDNHNMEVVVLVGRAGRLKSAQDTLDGYLDPTGSGSIIAAIKASSLGANGDDITVTGWRDYGGLEFGGNPFVGAIIDVLVLT